MARRFSAMALLALAGCGGGGGTTTAPTAPTTPLPNTPTTPSITYTAGVFPASSTFAAQCATPRSGIDPSTSRAYPDVAGSVLAEKHFLRSWNNELYLWFDEVTDRDPASVGTAAEYFALLKTSAAVSGVAKDQYHFTYNTADYYALSQSGTSLGYGISWDLVSSTPPRRVVVRYVQAGTPAATQGVTRGAELQSIDGISVVNDNTQSGVNTINNALFSPTSGSNHTLVFRTRSGTQLSTQLPAANVAFDAVPTVKVLSTSSGNLGYLLFNDHTAASETALVSAVNTLKAGNVQDLVLDLRYNGGGYLAIASELAYMIAGPTATAGKTFERLQFNSKYPSTNPVTGESLQPVPFYSTTGFATTTTALPSLNLSRLYVLTSDDTCSASESIINSLRGIGMQVFQIGGTTCGKPYGFYPRDNCSTTYFSIQFRGVNAVGFGDYAAGFSSTRTTGEPQANLPGCSASEDYAHDLGDVQEERLRVAMDYRATGACTGTLSALEAAPASSGSGLPVIQPAEPWRENRFLRP